MPEKSRHATSAVQLMILDAQTSCHMGVNTACLSHRVTDGHFVVDREFLKTRKEEVSQTHPKGSGCFEVPTRVANAVTWSRHQDEDLTSYLGNAEARNAAQLPNMLMHNDYWQMACSARILVSDSRPGFHKPTHTLSFEKHNRLADIVLGPVFFGADKAGRRTHVLVFLRILIFETTTRVCTKKARKRFKRALSP